MKKFIISLSTALLIAASSSIFAAPPLSAIQKAKNQVESVRDQLPIQVSNGLILTQVSYDSKTYTMVFRYYYTIPVTKPTATAIKETKLSMIHLLKANPNSEDMQILKSGISFHYNYYTEDGTFLYAVKITPSDIK